MPDPEPTNAPVANEPQNDSQQDEDKAPEVQAEPKVEEPKADPQPAPQAQPEEPAQAEESENVNIEEFARDRYKAPQVERPSADDLTKELSSLPTDEYGTVDASAVAEWFNSKLEQTRSDAIREAQTSGQSAAMAILSETAQQQELLDKFPDVRKDKELMTTIFDLRDAAALRGETLTLSQAANKWYKREQQVRSEGSQQANRTTEIQAAAHLETSGVTQKGNESEQQRLAMSALHGSGQEATDARRKMLTQLVQKDIEEGRITP